MISSSTILAPCGPWAPPGIRRPWPAEEYIRDGGHEGPTPAVNSKRQLVGLKVDDTVAQYDTLEGRTLVEPSNKVFIYSPRFGAVRQVVGLAASERRERTGNVEMPLKVDAPTCIETTARTKQDVQLGDQIGARPAVALLSKQGDGAMSSAIGPRGFQNSFKAYENLAVIRLGAYDASELPYLARGSNAAIAWSHTQAVQVVLERRLAMAEVKYDRSASVYTVCQPPGTAKLRLVKVASTLLAQPGDEVDFTIRFDNVGDQPIGNVAIMDSLSARLEYIPQSAQCSVAADFSVTPNQSDSVVLRCELADPLEPCQGGILRFRCRVR
jgi:uncharacterized repeat protein (TIGR01451 family)